MAQFFIGRPIFAWVLAIVVMIAGGLSIFTLPISQYPTIAPPAVSVTATYQGASARDVENSVTQIIEQNMKGLDGLRHLSATSDSNGRAEITLTFDQRVDPHIPHVQVPHTLQLGTPLDPPDG